METCSILPQSIDHASNVCEKLFSDFINPHIINSGTKGTIYRVTNKMTGIDTIIKIQLFDDNALNELITGCTLNSLSTDSFVKYIIWFSCKSLPEWAISERIQTSERFNYLFIEMEKADISFDTLLQINASIDIFALLFMLFSIIYALYLARKAFSFSHNDLHANNILLRELDNYVTRSYVLNNTKFTFETKYIPIIIDYDNATLNKNVSSPDSKYLYLIFAALLNNIKGIGSRQRNLYHETLKRYLDKVTSSSDIQDLEDLLFSDIFSGFIDE